MEITIKNKNIRDKFLDEFKIECKLRARKPDMIVENSTIIIDIYDRSIEYALTSAAKTAYFKQHHKDAYFIEDNETLLNIQFL